MDFKPTSDIDRATLTTAIQLLATRWTHITVLCSREDENGNTGSAVAGVGNEFARYGQLVRYMNAIEANGAPDEDEEERSHAN